MFFRRRKAAMQRVVRVRPAAIEGLEGRRLLSGSGGSMGPAMHIDNSGPSVNMSQQGSPGGKNANVIHEIKGVVTAVDLIGNKITVAGENGGAISTLAIPTTAVITIKGAVAGFSAIQTGAKVEIHLSAVNSSVVSVSAENPEVKGNDDNGPRHQGVHVEGTVSAVRIGALIIG